MSITHDILRGFDANPPLDTRGVFLDISKAFDRVWHDGPIFKLKAYMVFPVQGSILGPLFFLIYINDLPEGIISMIKIFADDSSLFSLILDQIRCSIELNNGHAKG